jgi:hypothetical protein
MTQYPLGLEKGFLNKWYANIRFHRSPVFLTLRQIRALAQSRHLLVKPCQLEDVEGYSIMIGGFGTVRVARMNNQLVAVKEIRVTGAPTDRARFSMVRPDTKVDDPQWGIISLHVEIRPRVEGVGSS